MNRKTRTAAASAARYVACSIAVGIGFTAAAQSLTDVFGGGLLWHAVAAVASVALGYAIPRRPGTPSTPDTDPGDPDDR